MGKSNLSSFCSLSITRKTFSKLLFTSSFFNFSKDFLLSSLGESTGSTITDTSGFSSFFSSLSSSEYKSSLSSSSLSSFFSFNFTSSTFLGRKLILEGCFLIVGVEGLFLFLDNSFSGIFRSSINLIFAFSS